MKKKILTITRNAGISAFDDDIPMEELEVDVVKNDPSDDLGQSLHNVQADCESETERLKFQKLLEDHHKFFTQIVKMD